ncbi:hypothetical protein [Haloprofundus salilacus]|nr:hypothetical protein [Haloprofundus salilacus]
MKRERTSDGGSPFGAGVRIELSTETERIRLRRQTPLGTYARDIGR